MKNWYIVKNEDDYRLVQSLNLKRLLQHNEGVFQLEESDFLAAKENRLDLKTLYETYHHQCSEWAKYDKRHNERKKALSIFTSSDGTLQVSPKEKKIFLYWKSGKAYLFYVWHESEEKVPCDHIEKIGEYSVGIKERTKKELLRLQLR